MVEWRLKGIWNYFDWQEEKVLIASYLTFDKAKTHLEYEDFRIDGRVYTDLSFEFLAEFNKQVVWNKLNVKV